MRIQTLFLVLVVGILGACTKDNKQDQSKMFQNFTSVQSITEPVKITDSGVTLEVVPTVKNAEPSLLVGYPMGLIGESSLFGAVITKVSVPNNAFFGGFKLSSFGLPIRTKLRHKENSWVLDLVGCQNNCTETTPVKTVFSIPVKELKTESNLAYLDLSSFGENLNILSSINGEDTDTPDPTTEWKHISSRTIAVDFSYSTLVFDLESKFQYLVKDDDGSVAKTTEVIFTSRWYSRLSSALSPYFESRTAADGVGYFMTNSRSSQHQLIRRFSIQDLQDRPVKYYIKNVPQRYRSSFAGSFEDWNTKLSPVLGHNLLTYEFIEKEDPRYDKIVAGDIRYNVLEWDLDNKASYGGLGPSISHPLTGETFSAQVLIQGPNIEKMYMSWFKTDGAKPDNLFLQSLNKSTSHIEVKLRSNSSESVSFNIPSQDPTYHDPIARNAADFIDVPEGYSYETYMDGYFRDMVTHELGHNLGLRHNFRGNLGDSGTLTVASVSRSVMEYLNRTFRHLDRVGDYDVMAIAYGYLGISPTHKDWFCTDGDSQSDDPRSSAECSSNDATNDPFSFFEMRIKQVVDKLIGKGSVNAPEWTEEDLRSAYSDFVAGLLHYANSAPYTAQNWSNFFGKSGRPTDPLDVPVYVLNRLDDLICGTELEEEADRKATPVAKDQVLDNLTHLRLGVKEVMKKFKKPWPLLSSDAIRCLPK